MNLSDALAAAWAFEFTREQMTQLLRLAGLPPALARRHWGELTAHERDELLYAARSCTGIAVVLSRDLSGRK